ncbi:hypothetical protein QTH90_20885 [Variovorax sp. J2P1-59]|uniref:hypothetical protein n=1 Tax=Variovorax flavidus TaxID=3053501 RepID=UPI002575C3F4|nr:hypothetical protein [Variovorax sp. J2P1-59]MDM0076877.1 hypothetical protein [Variovorax sp. J2P1-59]
MQSVLPRCALDLASSYPTAFYTVFLNYLIGTVIALPKLFPSGTSYVRIPSSKAACLRVLLETVERGSRHWTGGTVHVDKALQLADKFALLYGADATPAQRSAARGRYRAAAQVFFWPNSPTTLRWWLLASDGVGVVHEREQLQDAWAAGQRLAFGTELRLVRRQRAREQGGSKRWTWVLSPEAYERHLEAICALSRSHGPDSRVGERLDRLVQSLKALPGFAGIREQKLALQRAGREAWRRAHHADEPFPWTDMAPYLTKAFRCYHRPDPLRLDVLVRVMQHRVHEAERQASAHAEEVLAAACTSSIIAEDTLPAGGANT